jgi:hypothetical protein
MAEEPEVQPSEAPDDSAPADVVASEAAPEGSAAPSPNADAEREAFINEVVRRVAEQFKPAPQPTPIPPTTAAMGHDPLEVEAQAILDAKKALEDRVQREGGWSADTLLKHNELTDRTSALRSEVTLRGLREMESRQRVDALGKEDRWHQFYAQNKHRGDVELLRAAFERDELKAQSEAPKPPVAAPKTPTIRPVVDVSGPAEVSAAERKARTMTREQVQAEKSRLAAAGDSRAIRELDAKLRNGDVILK